MSGKMAPDAPLDRDEFRRWRDESDRALAAARLQADAGLSNWACFAAEQSAQLAVKALLHGAGRGPWGHDLVRLVEAAAAAGIDVPADAADAARRLSRHYIPARYPDAHPAGSPAAHYGRSDADEAVRDAERVLALVDGAWESLGG
jgi:HEPN domain-containing protein